MTDGISLAEQRQRTIDEFRERAVSVYGVHLDQMTTDELKRMMSRLEWWGTDDEVLALHYLLEDRDSSTDASE